MEGTGSRRGFAQSRTHPGRRRRDRSSRVPGPTDQADQGELRLSQPVFAKLLNVSPETVKAWEQGKRVPEGAAVRLLEVAEDHPEVLRPKLRVRKGG